MRVGLLMICVVFSACTPQNSEPVIRDIERQVHDLMKTINTSGTTAPGLFVPELSPQGFPLGPATGLTAKELRRLRTIDGRILVDLLTRRNGELSEFSMWLEKHRDGWLIAGWRPNLKRLGEPTIQRSPPLDVPRRFAAPSLRQTPDAVRVPAPAYVENTTHPTVRHDWLRIRPRIRAVKGRCTTRSAMTRQLVNTIPKLRQCHELSFPARKRASGRVILQYEGGRISVLESTTTSETFSRCLESNLLTQAAGGRDCNYLIDLILSTRK